MIYLQWFRSIFFKFWLSKPLCKVWDRLKPNSNLGQYGERIAERHLLRLGYFIVGRNQRSRHGEIDIIAVDRQTVVFVEVKTRSSTSAGLASEAVDDEKEKRISLTAAEYVRHRKLENAKKRFDLIAIDFKNSQAFSLQHFQNAFEYAGYE